MSGTITVTPLAAGRGNNDIQVVLEDSVPFTNCISEINNTLIDNANDVNVVMLMYNLIEYSDNYSKTSGSLWQYYRDEPALVDDGAVANFPGNCASFKYKQKLTISTGDNSTKAIQIFATLKYLSIFWETREMLLISCENNLILTWSANCVISNI